MTKKIPFGQIYLSNKGNLYILDDNNDFHLLSSYLFTPLCNNVPHTFSIDGKEISSTVSECSFESFKEFILKNKLYKLINEDLINNKCLN